MLCIKEGKLRKEKAKEICAVATPSFLLSIGPVPTDAYAGSPRPPSIFPLIRMSVSGIPMGNTCK